MVTTAVETAGKAVLFKAAELTADAVFPGSGRAVRVAKIIIDFRGALRTYDEGEGFFVNVPIMNLPGGEFSANLRIRVFADDPPPGLPADLAIDYVSTNGALDKLNAVEGADARPTNDAPPQPGDLGPLLRHSHHLSRSPAGHGLFGLRTAYLHRPTQTGWIVLQPPSGPARCEAWFTYQWHLSVARGKNTYITTCPQCGETVLDQHDCAVPFEL